MVVDSGMVVAVLEAASADVVVVSAVVIEEAEAAIRDMTMVIKATEVEVAIKREKLCRL